MSTQAPVATTPWFGTVRGRAGWLEIPCGISARREGDGAAGRLAGVVVQSWFNGTHSESMVGVGERQFRVQTDTGGPLGTVKFDPATHESTTPVLVFQTVGDSSSDTKLKLLNWSLVNPQTGQVAKSGNGPSS